ncbi:hypothetical protein LTS18_001069 [Coniosporium uncinatum]|uniref:Uncharacterized protein n=1 Tax=Coniosporium uncinatum TaxID=93489 RepID=A0ACC3DCL8_9PEZI|nr:hypothetical protein LTS18_001069 [Coniosporium uncinatum]
MAILGSLPGVESQALVDGKPLQEHPEKLEPNTVLRYIEATEGAKFSIRTQFTAGYSHWDHGSTASVSVDGKLVRRSVWSQDQVLRPEKNDFAQDLKGDPPIFVARFRYRSAALLQPMAIIPRPVPSAPRRESAALGLPRRSTRRVAQQEHTPRPLVEADEEVAEVHPTKRRNQDMENDEDFVYVRQPLKRVRRVAHID